MRIIQTKHGKEVHDVPGATVTVIKNYKLTDGQLDFIKKTKERQDNV